jgi:lipoyl(octanoyl) transferase|nr:MAG: octanoyltransferase [Bacteroidota bacterium]
MRKLLIAELGRVPYQEAWALQQRLQRALIEQKLRRWAGEPPLEPLPDVLLLLEHEHVYTLGKSGRPEHLLLSPDRLAEIGATYVPTDRGGDITYHGPGQIVGYPILDLDRHFTDIHRYLRTLEEVIIRVCADYGIRAHRLEKLTGVWVGADKICAMGIKCSRWVTMHGFAFNVNTDLRYFGYIIPCGISDKGITSLARLLGRTVPVEEVQDRLVEHFVALFNIEVVSRYRGEEAWRALKEEILQQGSAL